MRSIWPAEFIGTFFIVFLGCGSLIASEKGLMPGSHSAFVFGGTVLAMIAAFGHISYAHFNPAVSFGFFVIKKINLKELFLYWSAELSGALLASLLHLFIFGGDHSFGMNQPILNWSASFLLELIGTFMLMSVITVVATDERVHRALPAVSIGMTVAIISLVLGPLSGGSFNPARSFAPAVFAGNLHFLILYFSSTILGAALGALVMKRIL